MSGPFKVSLVYMNYLASAEKIAKKKRNVSMGKKKMTYVDFDQKVMLTKMTCWGISYIFF